MKIFSKFLIFFVVFFLFNIARPIISLASGTATLTLENNVINDNGGTATAADWTLAASPSFPYTSISGKMGSPAVTNAIVNSGMTYWLNEWGGVSAYIMPTWSCTNGVTVDNDLIILSDGQSTICTVANNDYPPTLHLRNVVTNDSGGTATTADWTLSATGSLGSPTNLSGSTPVNSGPTLKVDTYLLHASGPVNYTESSWNCVPEPDPDSSITLHLGENITCTITHDDVIAPQITVTETVFGGDKAISDFPLFIDGSSVTSGNINTSTIGSHTISVAPVSSYTAVVGGDCAPDGTITLAPGDVKNCTVTDTYVPPSHSTGIISSGGYSHHPINIISPAVTTTAVSATPTSANPLVPKFPKTGFNPLSVLKDLFHHDNSDSTATVISATVVDDQEKINSAVLPINLKIPKIRVNANIESVGVLDDETMGVPKNFTDVAWFNLGPTPGENGNAVIDGHSGRKDNMPAVFDNLYKLKKGDKIYTKDSSGNSTTFIVRESKKYDLTADDQDVFVSNDGKSHLNLITCAGVWNPILGTHSKRLVVFTDKEI